MTPGPAPPPPQHPEELPGGGAFEVAPRGGESRDQEQLDTLAKQLVQDGKALVVPLGAREGKGGEVVVVAELLLFPSRERIGRLQGVLWSPDLGREHRHSVFDAWSFDPHT